MLKAKFLILIFLLFCKITISQNKQILVILNIDNQINTKQKIKSFKDTSTINLYLKNKISKLVSKGFIEASIDSVITGNDTNYAYLYQGTQYKWGKIKFSQEFEIIGNNQINKSFKQNTNIDFEENQQKIEKTLKYFENNGYPFCEIALQDIKIDKNIISAKVELKKNRKILIDSIIIKGNAKISEKYLQKYLDIKPGDAYSEKQITTIYKKINNLSFLSANTNPDVFFYDDKVKIIIDVSKRKSSRFDGILGVIPQDKTTGRLLLTGELNLMLINSFTRAETIGFNWQKTDDQTQKVNLLFNYPYIFNTILGVGVNFNLLKQDTSFLNLRFRLPLNFILPDNKTFSVFFESKSSSLLSVTQYLNTSVLPDFADTKLKMAGLSIKSRNTDRYNNPTKGFILGLEGAVGEKQIYKNRQLSQELYEDIELNSLQFEGQLFFNTFIKFNKRISMKLANQTKYIHNNKLFMNELFRFGGLKSLRGFKENELYADFLSTATIQLNYFYEKYSNFYIFTDMAYYENHVKEFIHDTPIGIGFGTNFSSKAGVFSVSYAVGKQYNNPFSLQTARIHFGYIALF